LLAARGRRQAALSPGDDDAGAASMVVTATPPGRERLRLGQAAAEKNAAF
jgi:hypothetical protein